MSHDVVTKVEERRVTIDHRGKHDVVLRFEPHESILLEVDERGARRVPLPRWQA
jgi:hypothetical protein